MPDLIMRNGKITTLDPAKGEAAAVAIADGRILATGSDTEIMRLAKGDTQVIDLAGRRVIPGLNDSHTHLIRGGLNYTMELRWENVPSLADALRMLKEQAERMPATQWVRVAGGWSEFQFAERRMPTLNEVNQAAPDTPAFILHPYGHALINRAAMAVLGFNKDAPNPPGGEIQRDESGSPTGLLMTKPSALILYSTLAQGPKLPIDDQINSIRHCLREMNRLGITSVIDAGGGGQNYPEDYGVIQRLHDEGDLTVRVAYDLFAQDAGKELSDYEHWTKVIEPGAGSDMLRMNGAGENLTWSAADFETSLEPRPDLLPMIEVELEPIVELLAANKWPFRIRATYDGSLDRFLTLFERVNSRQSFATRLIIDQAETISDRNIERIKALGGGIAIQHRMAFQGEHVVDRYGREAALAAPPIRKMLEIGLPVGGGTDAPFVASYDPWVGLYWLTTGKTLGGMQLYDEDNVLTREEALRLWTHGSAWFSGEADVKGTLAPGMYADLAVLSADYITVPANEIRHISSLLTVVGGKIVHGGGCYADLAPPLPPVSPSWSPVNAKWSPDLRLAAATLPLGSVAHCSGRMSHCGKQLDGHGIVRTISPLFWDTRHFWAALGRPCFAV